MMIGRLNVSFRAAHVHRFEAAARDRGRGSGDPRASSGGVSDSGIVSLPQAVVLLRSLAVMRGAPAGSRDTESDGGDSAVLASFEREHVTAAHDGTYAAPASLRDLFNVANLGVMSRCTAPLQYLFLRYARAGGAAAGAGGGDGPDLAPDDWMSGMEAGGDATPSLRWPQLLQLLVDFDVVPALLTDGAAAAAVSELYADPGACNTGANDDAVAVVRRIASGGGASPPEATGLSFTGFCEALHALGVASVDPRRAPVTSRGRAPGALAALLARMDPSRVLFAAALAPENDTPAAERRSGSGASAVARLYSALTRGTAAAGVTRAGYLLVLRAAGLMRGFVGPRSVGIGALAQGRAAVAGR